MDQIICKKCGSEHYVKNGKAREQQRYKGKECGFNFVVGDQREKFTPEMRALSLLLYDRGKASYGFIAKLFKVSSVAVMKLIKREAAKMPEPEIDSSIQEVTFDEMWHFVNKKSKLWFWRAVEHNSNRRVRQGVLAIVLLRH
jgi:transposase-like protein